MGDKESRTLLRIVGKRGRAVGVRSHQAVVESDG